MVQAKLPEQAQEWLNKEESSNKVICFAILFKRGPAPLNVAFIPQEVQFSPGVVVTIHELLHSPRGPQVQAVGIHVANEDNRHWDDATNLATPRQTITHFYSGNTILDEWHQVKHCPT